MANVQGMCSSFKQELLTGHHNFGVSPVRAGTTVDTFKAALFLTTASRGVADTVYNTTGELAGTGNYTQGGKVVTVVALALDGTTAHTQIDASIVWTALTSSGNFDCLVFYNSTQADKQISVHTFADTSMGGGDLTITMPTNNGTTGQIRIA